MEVHYLRVNSQVSVYYWLQFSNRFTKLPSARFLWICFFWENWEHSGQMKSLLSVSVTKMAKHLKVVPTTGQVSVFWSSAIDALIWGLLLRHLTLKAPGASGKISIHCCPFVRTAKITLSCWSCHTYFSPVVVFPLKCLSKENRAFTHLCSVGMWEASRQGMELPVTNQEFPVLATFPSALCPWWGTSGSLVILQEASLYRQGQPVRYQKEIIISWEGRVRAE